MTETFCTKTDVQLAAGNNATTLTDAQYTTLINRAEASLCLDCGEDLVTGYAGYNAVMKLILEEGASCWASIGVIKYEPNVWSLATAQTKADINWAQYLECVKRIKDRDKVALIK